MGDVSVPMMWSGDLSETLDFYQTLGYEVTAKQTRPYNYGAVARNGYSLHFGPTPKDRGTAEECHVSCVVFVDEVAELHQRFTASLRARFGRVPASGLPRITRFRPGQTRFSVVDPVGNTVVYVVRHEPDPDYGGSPELQGLQRTLDNARILRYSKLDDKAARRALESGLRRFSGTAAPVDKAHALAELIELAVATNEPQRVTELRAEIAALDLSDEDRAAIDNHLQIATDLEQWLTETD
ncbi:glyoxalase [Nocardia sp. NPDC051052]|uniref:glyoxalase n=1 Tax=Nocardia sp. NPDC051052 TaxID=3364322 RepID=UPI00378CCD08